MKLAEHLESFYIMSASAPTLSLNVDVRVSSMVLTSTLLRRIIAQPEAMKIMQQHYPESAKVEEGELSVRAISRVIAESQRRIYGVDTPPAQYKDRVRRALAGQSITPSTIHLFADAFEFEPKTVEKLLAQLSQENALSSSALAYLQEFPQASVHHAFIDVSVREEELSTLSINCVIASLELGCSSVIVILPSSRAGTCKATGCVATQISDEGHWLLELDEPLAPLSHAVLTLELDIETSTKDATHAINLPFVGKYHATALRVQAEHDQCDFRIHRQQMGSLDSTDITDFNRLQNRWSMYFSALENEVVSITW